MKSGEIFNELFFSLNSLHRKEVCFGESDSLAQCLTVLSIPKNGSKMHIVSKKLGVDKSTLTRLVDNLEKLELAYRKKNSKDKRSVKVYLTKKGLLHAYEYRYKLDILGDRILNNAQIDKKELLNILERLVWELWKYNFSV